jgi:hypothetical protein
MLLMKDGKPVFYDENGIPPQQGSSLFMESV